MRILWVSHLIPNPPKAGVLLRSHYLVKELAKHHRVDLLAFSQKNLLAPYFDTVAQGEEKSYALLKSMCQRVEFMPCPTDKSKWAKHICALKSLVSRSPYNINWLQSEAFHKKIQQWHAENSYDLIHFDTISLAPYLHGLNDTTFALDHHNVESHMLIRRASIESNWFKKCYFWQEGKRLEKFEKQYCPQMATNITCSDLDTERFERVVPKAKFVTIPNGVDIDFFKPSKLEPNLNRLIFIGTLDWYPNTRAVRYITHEIWPLVREKFPDMQVDIIGSRPPQDLVELSQRDSRFNVHGFVDDLSQYLEHAAIYLCPIDDGGGTKLKILDAFAAGKAVIAHPVACEGLHVTENNNVLLADTPEAYLEKITQLVDMPELRKNLEKNARQHVVDQFSFASIGKQLADHYEAVVKAKRTVSDLQKG